MREKTERGTESPEKEAKLRAREISMQEAQLDDEDEGE